MAFGLIQQLELKYRDSTLILSLNKQTKNTKWAETAASLISAKLCRTILPEGIKHTPNRDCTELGIDPETGEDIDP